MALARLRHARSTQREFYARSDDVTVWMRRFKGKDGGPAGLALQIAGSCNRLPPLHLLSQTDLDALTNSCAQRQHADFDTGLLLFKLASDGRLLPAGQVQGQLFRRLSAPSSTHWTASASARRSPTFRCWPTAMKWRYGGRQIPNGHYPKTCQAPVPCTTALCMAATLRGPARSSVSSNREPHAGSTDRTGPAAMRGLVFPVLPDHTPKGHTSTALVPRQRPACNGNGNHCMPSRSAGTAGEQTAGKHPGA